MQIRALGGYHPALSFGYFAGMIACSMLMMHPVCLLLSLLSSAACAWLYSGGAKLRGILRFLLPLSLFAIVLNPLISHEGATILTYFSSGNPLTQESILYGFAASAMLSGMILWFSAFNSIVTSDRIVYLFGKISPALALLFSMALRFSSRIAQQAREVLRARKLAGVEADGTARAAKLRNAGSAFSVLVTWALESSVTTSDSMRARGYGTRPRTAYALYRWTARDTLAALALGGILTSFLSVWALGGISWQYYPTFRCDLASSVPAFVLYALLCAYPLILEAREAQKWRSLE